MSYNLITILGPTACGKTKLGVALAEYLNGEIISADSRQVYKQLDIGTGKDIHEYTIDEKKAIAYHLIDIIDPKDEYNLFSYQSDFISVYNEIIKQSRVPIQVGGTGLYLSSIVQNYKLIKEDSSINLENLSDNELKGLLKKNKQSIHNTTDLLDRGRLEKAVKIAISGNKRNHSSKIIFNSLVIGIAPDREIVRKRITARLKQRLKEGMIDEVEGLLKSGITHSRLNELGLEYRYLSLYLHRKVNYNDMFQKLNGAIHSFSKKQMTWFRKMEKEGVKINWIHEASLEKAKEIIEKVEFNFEAF
ncbi:MAG TPA: tRNA (adenosine(37)-N6)-dimethylallyltransferase MiaA [Ignavibacteriaceae bacterium]|mgnify:CR=1 FL=1|nr:tRNA (adenosine(37)-N6)-dimethylallyltransferase MiaA [Ignavibacteriaceae bacterium]